MSGEDDKPRLMPSERDELLRWIELSNERKGFGGLFARKTQADKAVIEACVMDEWVEAMEGAFGIDIADVRQNPSDPPDFFARVGGKNLETELVELITRRHVERVMGRGKKENPQHGQLFMDTQWTLDRFKSDVSAAIAKKATNYANRGIFVDVLLLYTGEPWLSPPDVRNWLLETTFETPCNVGNAFLLMEYFPRFSKHWPVFRLFGTIGNKNP